MFWKPYLLSLLVGAVSGSQPSQLVPRSFIVEYEDATELPSDLRIAGAIKKMDFDSEVFKGASYQFDDSKSTEQRMTELLALPTIRNAWPNTIVPGPDDKITWVASHGSAPLTLTKRSNSSDTFSTHVQTQVDKLRAKGITGEGVKIAIIDTGIDYKHPALGGCFGPDCLVVGGYDFVGDNYNGTNTPAPDDDPIDCAGHGTHVAGIVAAQPNDLGFTGAAPGVKLAAYRVFGCTGSAQDDVIIAAFLRAQQEGANIISLSLGGPGGWRETALSVVAERIVAKGVIVVAAAGNSGDEGLFVASSPAGGKGVAAIASYDNSVYTTLSFEAHYTVSGGPKQIFDYLPGNPSNWTDISLPLWAPSFDSNQTDQGCNPFPDDTPDLSNKIVLIRRGGCLFADKAQNAMARGAKYVMLYNNVPGLVFVDLGDLQNLTAVAMVPATQGVTWVRDLAAGKNVTLDIGDPLLSQQKVQYDPNNSTGGFVSYFTSWGPSFESYFGPTFGTPGGNILSTWPVANGSYALLSGTSMATPLASAIYALLSNVRKTFDPVELQNVLAATAKPVQANPNGEVIPLLASTAQQGAGMIQAYDAAYATTVLSDANLAFNETALLTDKKFTVSNTGHEAVTYELDVIGAATAYTFSNSSAPDPFPGLKLDASFATVHLSKYKVTIPAGGKTEIVVKVIPPSVDAAQLPVYGGYIRLNGTNGEKLSLPYQGIAGDFNAHKVLNMTYVSRSYDVPDFPPALGNDSNFAFPRTTNENLTDADAIPVLVYDLFFGSPLAKVEILSTSNGTTNLGYALGSPIPWNNRGPNTFGWNGQLADNSWVVPGSYKFRTSALRIHGDANDTKQYEVSESPSFTIRYT